MYYHDSQVWTAGLINEAEDAMKNSYKAIAELKAKTDGTKNIKNGISALEKNVKTAEKSVVQGVEPKKIQHAFQASKFNAEIAGVYPNESKKIQDLKN